MPFRNTEVTDFLIHHILPNFPVQAEALWTVADDNESGDCLGGGRRNVTTVSAAGGRRRGKKRRASALDGLARSSAHVPGANEEWWAFVMRGFEYEECKSSELGRRAIVSVQYTAYWGEEHTGSSAGRKFSGFSGAKADVVFLLRSHGKGRGLWMKEVDSTESAVRVRLTNAVAQNEEVVGDGVGQAVLSVDCSNEDVALSQDIEAPATVPSQGIDSRVEKLHEELNNLRSAFESRCNNSVVPRSLGSDLQSRLRVIGVSRILEHLTTSRPPPGMEKKYKFTLNPSRLDGSDTCGNAEVEIYLTDSAFTEFQDLPCVSSTSPHCISSPRSYPCPSWLDLSCYNPMSPRPVSIVFPFASDFFSAIGMSPIQRILNVFKPPRRDAVVPCVLGSTEMFRVIGNGTAHCRRDFLPGVCRTSLQNLSAAHPNGPDYFVSVLRQGNSSLHSETMQSNHGFSLIEVKSKDLVLDSRNISVPGTGKSNGFRLKWTPLGWNAKNGTADSGVYGKITASMSLVFLKDDRLIASALPRWNPQADNTDTEGVEDEVSAEALLGKILRSPTAVE